MAELFPEHDSHKNALSVLIEQAERGSPEAQYRLGMCFKEGKGVRRCSRKALFWLRQAAGNGCEKAVPEYEELEKWWRGFFE